MKYTKGNWEAKNILGYPRAKDHPYVECKGKLIVELKGGDVDEIEANVKLISASPDLLEALIELKSSVSFLEVIDTRTARANIRALKAIKKAIE